MKVVVINGNPKRGGFTEGVLDIVTNRLRARGVEVQTISLAHANIQECIGCFNCLKTGACVLTDDTQQIIQLMKEADGFVIGSPVRNCLTTACYKRFIERITYTLGFPLLLDDKYTLAISSVGYMGGKALSKRFCGLQDVFRTRLSGFLFFSVGIPAKVHPSDRREILEKAADKLMDDIRKRRPRRLFDRISFFVERQVMQRFMFEKHPEVYTHVRECRQRKGYMK
jgi:multimeric flavodoxin WrbA